MAVTVTAALVSTVAADPVRPPHNGWNNPYGDPAWVQDIDWYRRVQLTCTGSAGEVGSVVNWELYDDTITFVAQASLTGAVAADYGALANCTETWTIWAWAGTKYVNTKQPPICTIRANNPRVQLLLGPAKAAGAVTNWKIAAFLPGAGKVPTAQTTIQIKNVVPATVSVAPTTWSSAAAGTKAFTATVGPVGSSQEVTWSSSNTARVTVDANGLATAVAVGAATITATSKSNPSIKGTATYTVTALVAADATPDSSWTKTDIISWLLDNGVDLEEPALSRLNKSELLDLVADVLSEDDE